MAAMNMITAAVSKALYETQLETLENFQKYLAEKDDVDMEFMEELIGGFKATLQAPKAAPVKGKGKGAKKADSDESDNADKKKRAPSAYTMYIQYQMHQLKKENPDIKSGKDLMAKAVAAWGELTDENKAELKSMLKENPSLTSEQLVTRVRGGGAEEAETEPKDEHKDESETEAEPAEEEEPPKTKKATKKANKKA